MPELIPKRLKSGSHFARDDDGNLVRYGPGDIIKLTPRQCVSFANLVEDPDLEERRGAEARRERELREKAEAEARAARRGQTASRSGRGGGKSE